MRCVYCGQESGEYDEHEECAEAALEAAVDEEDQDDG